MPINNSTMAAMHTIRAIINRGIYSGFSLLSKAKWSRVGPVNIRARQIPSSLMPLINVVLFVLFCSFMGYAFSYTFMGIKKF